MRRTREHIYKFDHLVIGGTLPALLYGYSNSLPVLCIDKKIPLKFEISKNDAFGDVAKVDLWNRLGASLSLAGLMPFSDKAKSFKIIEEKYAEAYTEVRKIRISFNKLLIFDEDGVQGLEEPAVKIKKEYKVYDWLINRGMSRHSLTELKSEDDFVKEVLFYKSERKGVSNITKDIVAISRLTEKQIHDLDYSENFARLKAIRMMKNAGLRGYSNGFSKIKQATQYYAIAVEHDRREVEAIGRDTYRNTSTIEHCYYDEEQVQIANINAHLKTIKDKLW